ncbi:hypothetical protein IV203_023657 [Nitzschia inconspicua]|uniref:Uncharacterized protein n=1 Tax=Nitzschia inconspicua TaxID=303405 RepID=A0A9K3KDF4_9STRA|nr:hypothetical protein IV203_023657 [Nitzschia inconspicua]
MEKQLLSSTFPERTIQSSSMVPPPSLKQPHQPRKGAKRALSVTFPIEETDMVQVVAEIEPCMNFSEADRKSLFYARSDFHFSRSTARVIAKESERYGHSKHLDGVFISAFQQQAQDALNLWVLHGHCRRGLERWANTHHGRNRKDDQHMYTQGVLRAQREMKLTDACGGDVQAQAERLREVGYILSRKSRLFAQMMGEADAQAAKWEYGTPDQRPNESTTPEIFQQALNVAYPGGDLVGTPAGRLRVMPPQRRNLGFGGPSAPQRKVNRVADLPSRTVNNGPRRSVGSMGPASGIGAGAPKITIKPRTAGRVPRMA